MADDNEDVEDLIAQEEAEASGRMVAAEKARREAAQHTTQLANAKTPRDTALLLVKLGFLVAPSSPCGWADVNDKTKPGKRPLGSWKNKTENYCVCSSVEDVERLWKKYPRANVGVFCGGESGIYCLDIDRKKRPDGVMIDGFKTLRELGHDLEAEIPPTIVSRTPSGGWHVYFKCSGERKIWESNPFLCDTSGLDIRGECTKGGLGGFAVEAPSCYQLPTPQELAKIKEAKEKKLELPKYQYLHGEIKHYKWIHAPGEYEVMECPEWLLDLAEKAGQGKAQQDDLPVLPENAGAKLPLTKPTRPTTAATIDEKRRRASAYLAKCPPAIEGQYGSDKAFYSAIKICVGFDLDDATAFDLLSSEYNPRCVPSWSADELWHKIHDAQEVKDRPRGFLLNAERPQHAATSGDIGAEAPRAVESEQQIVTNMDERLLNPEGLVGKIANYIRRSSIVERPQFALSAALCLSSALIGRRVFDAISRGGVNLYALNLLDGGGGKDDAYTAGDRFLYALGNGYERRVLNGPASGAGLIDLVIERQAGLITVDEAGEFLARMLESNKPDGNYTQLRKIIKELYSRSNLGALFKQDQRARTQSGKFINAETIRQPSVSLYLTGAPNRIASALSSAEVTDGLIPRFLFFFDEGAKRIDLRHRREPIPGGLLREIEDAMHWLDMRCVEDEVNQVRALMLDTTDEALDLFQQFEDEFRLPKDKKRIEGDYACGAWVRCVENARRVAANVECLRNPRNPRIDQYDAEYSVALLKFLCTNAERFIRGKLADDEFYQTVVKVQDLVRRKGERSGQQRQISRSDLLRSSKMDVVEFDKVIAFLKETEWLEEFKEDTSTRPRVIYRSACIVD